MTNGGTGVSALGASVTVTAGGDVVYNPTAVAQFRALTTGSQLTDTFSYAAYDGTNYSNDATVTFVVTGVNDAPVAVTDSYRVARGRVSDLQVLSNDFDVDGAA